MEESELDQYIKELEQVEKAACENSLAQFVYSAWHIIEPGAELVWNWHLDTICGYLMAFHRGELPDKRLIINIPPGTLKSILVSVMFPAWTWISNPQERYLCISNEQGLAIRDALRMKQIVTSDWFQSKWPLKLQSDQNEKTLYANEQRGFRQSQGITASNTGKRGSCFPKWMSVKTQERGDVYISDVKVGESVLSFNFNTQAKEFKRVTHTVKEHAKKLYIIEFGDKSLDSNVFDAIYCTADHEIYTAHGFKRADSLTKKDIVYSSANGWQSINFIGKMKYKGNVHCLTVEGNHNFFVSHTCSGIDALASNCLIVDDPIDAAQSYSDVIRQSVNDTWDRSLSTRLNDLKKSGVLLIMQRVHEGDLAGHLLKKVHSKWTTLSIPMRYEGNSTFDAGKDLGRPELNDPRKKKGELLFPAKFPMASVKSLEEDLGEYGSAAQLQQRPAPAGGGILKKHWWRVWPDDIPLPACNHIFLSLDTAFSEKDSKTAAYSAMTRWGIFWHEERERYCIMALGMWFGRCGYDELRRTVQDMVKKYNPDAVLIEKKATGITLIQDMKRAIPGKVRSYTPGRGEDKISRAHSVSPMLQSGQVYIPNKVWALGDAKNKTGLIEYAGMFPNGAPPTADLTDTITQALIYLRNGNWAGEHDDDKEILLTRKDSIETEEYLEDERDGRTETRFYG